MKGTPSSPLESVWQPLEVTESQVRMATMQRVLAENIAEQDDSLAIRERPLVKARPEISCFPGERDVGATQSPAMVHAEGSVSEWIQINAMYPLESRQEAAGQAPTSAWSHEQQPLTWRLPLCKALFNAGEKRVPAPPVA